MSFAKEHRDGSTKFSYYLIGLSVSAIGFAVYSTKDTALSLNLIPLGIAIMCWGISIFYGLRFQINFLNLLRLFNERELVSKGVHQSVGSNPSDVAWGKKTLDELAEELSQTGGTKFAKQEWSFYSGMIFYLIWHIWEMYLRSQC